MPTILITFWNVLTSKLVGPLATAAAIVLAIALIIARAEKADLSRRLDVAINTISQLKGSLDFQNQMVADLGTKTAVAQKTAREAMAASSLAHASDAAQAAALVAAPVETDLVKACAAADQHILENIK
jgi:hypothetical protein